jgi:hypothetical protein
MRTLDPEKGETGYSIIMAPVPPVSCSLYPLRIPRAHIAMQELRRCVSGSAAIVKDSSLLREMRRKTYEHLEYGPEEGSGKRLAKVYVKAYARKAGGAVVFYKDGYTDLRGLFDYASLTTDETGTVERFAILAISDTHGAVIREVAPPKR